MTVACRRPFLSWPVKDYQCMKIMTGMKDGWMGEKEEKKGRRERGRELGKKGFYYIY